MISTSSSLLHNTTAREIFNTFINGRQRDRFPGRVISVSESGRSECDDLLLREWKCWGIVRVNELHVKSNVSLRGREQLLVKVISLRGREHTEEVSEGRASEKSPRV